MKMSLQMIQESMTAQDRNGSLTIETNKTDDGQAPQHRLTVYVTTHCANCAYAMEVAVSIRRAYPQTLVQVVDLANPQEPAPDLVFATPTYLLDDRIWSLGNPSAEQIDAALG